MAYRIFFSGLLVFVEYPDPQGQARASSSQVDVLLLNPCANHHARAQQEESDGRDSRPRGIVPDRHLPQLTGEGC